MLPDMWLRALGKLTVPAHRISGARRFFVDVAGARIPVWDYGPSEGEPWLLLHGLASSALAWRDVALDLRPKARVLVPEMSTWSGFRRHDDPSLGMTLEQGTALVETLVEDVFGGRPVTLGGMSLGGWIAVRIALDHPRLARRLLLVDAAGWRDQDWQRVERLVRLDTRRDLDDLYDAIFADTPWTLRLVREAFFHAYRSQGVGATLEAIGEEDAYDARDLARLELPVGLVWGARDGLFPPAVGRAMARALPRSRLRLLEDCGHNPHWERPRELVRAVRELDAWSRMHP